MRYCLISALVTLGLAVLLAGTALAGVGVRVGVRPDSIPQCGSGHLSAALWNAGGDSIRVRVSISLVYQDTLSFGPISGIASLGPHGLKTRQFDFNLPPGLPEGRYALALRAAGSDSTYDRAVAPWTVLPSDCLIPASPIAPPMALLQSLLESLALEPDRTTPAVRDSWGGLKRRYYTEPKKK